MADTFARGIAERFRSKRRALGLTMSEVERRGMLSTNSYMEFELYDDETWIGAGVEEVASILLALEMSVGEAFGIDVADVPPVGLRELKTRLGEFGAASQEAQAAADASSGWSISGLAARPDEVSQLSVAGLKAVAVALGFGWHSVLLGVIADLQMQVRGS